MKKLKDFKKYINKGHFAKMAIVIITALVVAFIIIHPVSFGHNPNLHIEDITVSNLRFTNAEFEDNELEVMVQNTTSTTYQLRNITVTFKDSSNNIITKINGYIGDSIEPNEIRKLDVKTDIDLSDTNSVEYTVNN